MDNRTFQVLLAIATGGVGIWLYKRISKSNASDVGGTGGLVGAGTDLVLGEKAPDTEASIFQPGTTADIPNPATYNGMPVLGFFVTPSAGGSVTRQAFHAAYPIVVEMKNMTPDTLQSPITVEVDEGGERVVTITDVKTLEAGQRKQFTIMVNTKTVFGVSQATARVRFGAQFVCFRPYLIA